MNQDVSHISDGARDNWSLVQKKLQAARRRWRFVELGGTGLRGIGILLLVLIVALLLDNLLALPRSVRSIFALGFGAGCLYLLVVRPLKILFRPLTDEMVARHVERRYDQLDNRFINAVQLHEERFDDPASREMARAQLDDAAGAIGNCNMRRSTDTLPLRRWGKWVGCIAVLLLVYSVGFAGHFQNAVRRFASPHTYVAPISDTKLDVTPGDTTCLQGDSLVIRAEPAGVVPETATLIVDNGDGQRSTYDMPFEGSSFRHELVNLQKDMRYRIHAGDTTSRPYHITIRTRPRVSDLRLEYDYPEYTQLPDGSETNESGNIRAVVGTTIKLSLRASRKLSGADLTFHPLLTSRQETQSDPVTLPLKRRESQRWGRTFEVEKSGTYTINIEDPDGIPNAPATRHIWARNDQPPQVELITPDEEIKASPDESVTVVARASDDYNLHSLTLHVRQNRQEWEEFRDWAYDARTTKQQEGAVLDLSGLRVQPGDTVRYFFRADDGCPERTESEGKSAAARIIIQAQREVATSDETAQDSDESEKSTTNVADSEDDGEKTGDPTARQDDLLNQRDRMQRMLKKVKQFKEDQRENLKMTRQLAEKPVDEFSSGDEKKLQKVREDQLKWGKYFQEKANDLSDLPSQDFGLGSMVGEHMEVYSEVQAAADALEKKSMEIATSAEESATAKAEKIEENIEKWLEDHADQIAWKMEASENELDVPLTDLPDQLEDLIGELMAEEQELMEQAEDANANTLGSFDEGIGWSAMDGPIANMSAKGVTGNRLPNANNVGGRSGEGRTGKSSGQFVEESATGKGGRRTPTRKTSDPYEAGTVKDSSGEPPTGATGGGKASGFGREGFRGQTPNTANRLKRLAQQQKQLIGKAKRIAHGLKTRRYPTGKLPETIKIMEDLHKELDSGSYVPTAARRKRVVLENLNELKAITEKVKKVRQDQSNRLPERMRRDVAASLRAPVPDEYEEMVRNYFEELSK